MEHLPDPIKILSKLSNLLAHDGEMFIEVPNSEDVLLTLYKNDDFQNFTYWSQNLYLFNSKNLTIILNSKIK